MRRDYLNMIRVALIYGTGCILVQFTLHALGCWLFPDHQPGDDELAYLTRWLHHGMIEKIIGLFLLSITAFLATRAYHPTWKLGVATATIAGLAFELIGTVVWIVRFGFANYQEYNRFFYTMLWTVLIAQFFGRLAVRQQRLDERRVACHPAPSTPCPPAA